MITIRPIAPGDTETFINIAFNAGIGMTSMPKNREALLERVTSSLQSFSKKVNSPAGEFYLFVLEDLSTGTIGGTCAITAQTAHRTPLYFYRIERREKHEDATHAIKKIPTLRAVQYRNYWSEIGSLYLGEDFRKSGNGRLLSLSRFLFIADFPQRFSKMIFAEMRGHIDTNHTSKFWEGIGRHFIETDFNTLMHLRDEGLADLTQALPAHPIYIELLPKEVQDSIGKIHDETLGALTMLSQEGFQVSPEIDICDGGPKIESEVKDVRTVKDSLVETIAAVTPQASLGKPTHIVSNRRVDFRACLTTLQLLPTGGISIPTNVAAALNVNVGDSVRYISLHPQKESRL